MRGGYEHDRDAGRDETVANQPTDCGFTDATRPVERDQ